MKRFKSSKCFRFLLSLSIVGLVAGFIAPTASADITQDEYKTTLLKLSISLGGTTGVSALDKQVQVVAVQENKTPLQIATRSLSESRAAMMIDNGTVIKRSETRSSGSGGGVHNNLSTAEAGAIFVSMGNNTFGWNHGHTGIYLGTKFVVEAPGNGPARKVYYTGTVASGTAVIQRVQTTVTRRKQAATRAKTYIGRPYNRDIIRTNRDDNYYLNCGQLVWAAYYYGAGVNLTNDRYIYPYSLRDSTLTSTYITVNP